MCRVGWRKEVLKTAGSESGLSSFKVSVFVDVMVEQDFQGENKNGSDTIKKYTYERIWKGSKGVGSV